MNLEQIDTSTTAGKAEVMRLAAEGRRVAARCIPGWLVACSPWMELPSGAATWDWRCSQYAIISEPVGPEEVWAKVDVGSFHVGTTKGIVENWVKHHGGSAVRYIRADLAVDCEPSIPASVLRSLADRWASDRGYVGSPVDDIRALVGQPTADLAGEAK